MTIHLSPNERVDALDGVLAASRHAHLEGCASCQQELRAVREVHEALMVSAEGDVPEPSPLFWNHFEARVGAAVNEATVPWWHGSMRAWVTLAAAAVILLAVWLSPLRTPPVDDVVVDAELEVSTIGESVQWQFMSGVLESLEQDDARVVLAPTAGAVDTAFESLSAAERETFARLLQAELTEGSY
jgi:hypothetical protein